MDILLGSGVAYKTHTLKETEELAIVLGYAGLELMPPPSHVPLDQRSRDTNYEGLQHARVVHGRGDIYTKEKFRTALTDTIAIATASRARMINMHPASRAQGGRQNVIDGIAYIKEMEEKTGITITYELLVDPRGVREDKMRWFAAQQAYSSIDAWITDVKTYNLHATLDTAHIATWNQDPEPYIHAVGDNLTHAHFSDFNTITKEEHLVPGEGNVALIPFLQTLHHLHPTITLTVEIQPQNTKEQVEAAAKESIAYIKQALLE